MRKQNLPAIFSGIGFLILILDTKTALSGAAVGIEMCFQTLIPSLFPFIFLSVMITASLSGKSIPIMQPLGRLLHIPKGAESVLLIGILGGYAVGAQCVTQAVRSGSISREKGKRMLAFCSNAGPSFLFGIGSRLFSDISKCWVLWAIHIVSALLVGILVSDLDEEPTVITHGNTIGPTVALRQALQVLAIICGWVILFRVLLAFCQRWFLWALPEWAQYILSGLLELANGCYTLSQIENVRLRFVLCSVFLAFGGLCVAMQTFSVCDGFDCTWYLPGKLLQSIFSLLMAWALISREMALPCLLILTALYIVLLIFQRKVAKKDSILSGFAV